MRQVLTEAQKEPSPMIPSLTFDRSAIALREATVVNALLEITAPIVPVDHRAPLDIIAVIPERTSA